MMHQNSLEPAAIRFTLKCLQESARRSGYFLPAFFMYLYPQEPQRVTYYLEVLLVEPNGHRFNYSNGILKRRSNTLIEHSVSIACTEIGQPFLFYMLINNFVLWLKLQSGVRFKTSLNLNCLQFLGAQSPRPWYQRFYIGSAPLPQLLALPLFTCAHIFTFEVLIIINK